MKYTRKHVRLAAACIAAAVTLSCLAVGIAQTFQRQTLEYTYRNAMVDSADPLSGGERTAEVAKAESAVVEIVGKYRATQSAQEREDLSKALANAVAKDFDLRQEARSRELKQLAEKLHKLQELHTKRVNQKEQIVGDRVRQLVRDAEGLGWGADHDGTVNFYRFDPYARPKGKNTLERE